jgi:pentatricopeptide repeat protein
LPEAVLDLGLVDASNLTDGALASSAIWRQSRAHVEGGESLTSTPASEDFGSFVRDTVLEGLTRSLPRLEKAVSRMNVRDDAGRDALSIVWSSVYAKMKVVREDKGKGREDRGNINESDGMGWLYEPDGQVAALKVFLHSFLQALSYDTVSGQAVTTSRKAQVSTNLNGLLSLLPSPTPLPICQTLLSHYARSDAVEFGNTSRSSLAALRATWERMREEGVKKDAKTYMMYMEGLGRKGDFEGLKEAWEELRVDEACRQSWEQEEKAKLGGGCGVADDRVCSFLVGRGDSHSILCRPTASSCSSIPPYPPISTFNMFISHLLLLPEGQGTDLALSLFEYLASPNNPYEPDMVTVNTVLRHYAKQKDTAGMLDLLQRLPAIGPSLKPDVVTYTTVIGGLLDAGQRDAARSLIDVMQNEGIEPNLHTYSLLIADLARTGQRQQIMAAEELMRKLPEQGMKPTEVTWTSLIGGYFKGGYVADAWRTLATLRATGVALNRVTYNMILRWCAGMPSNEHLDGPTVRYINKALGIGAGGGGQRRLRGHVCLDVLEAMRAAHVQPNEDSWFIVLDGLARAQRWDEAREVMDEMRRRRFVVSPDSALGRVVRRIRSSL